MTVEVLKLDFMENALVMGLLFSALATLALTTSGGHYNPMVTISLMIVSQVSMPKGLSYIIAHMIGSLLGGGMLAYTASTEMIDASREYSVLGMPRISHNFGQNSAFIAEFTGSCLIMCMYWTSLKEVNLSSQVKGYMNGVAVTVATMVFYQVSGACFNPMLIFGPSLISRTIRNYHWIYYFGPLMGCFCSCVVLDTMEKQRDVVMNKRKIVKIKDEIEEEIAMAVEDEEYEERIRLQREEEAKAGNQNERGFELSDDEEVERNLGEIKEEEYEGSDHGSDADAREKARIIGLGYQAQDNSTLTEMKDLTPQEQVRELGTNSDGEEPAPAGHTDLTDTESESDDDL